MFIYLYAKISVDLIIPVNFSGILQPDGCVAHRAFANGRGKPPMPQEALEGL